MRAIVLQVGDAAVDFNATQAQTVNLNVTFDLTAGEMESLAAYNAELLLTPIAQGVSFVGAVAAPSPVLNTSPQVFATGNQLQVAANLSSGERPITDGGGLFTAQITIAAGTPAGQYTISLDPNDTALVRGDASTISGVQLVGGTVSVNAVSNSEIAGRVWNDIDEDAIEGALEPGIGGIAVKLLDADTLDSLQVTATAADGTYSFSNLPAGSYVVEVERPSQLIFNAPGIGGDESTDSDFSANGRTNVITVDGTDVSDEIDAALLPPPYQNQSNPLDVDLSESVTLNDALLIVAELRARGARELALPPDPNRDVFVDVSGDNRVTLNDALLIVAHLREALGLPSGEGEPSSELKESTKESEAVGFTAEVIDEAFTELAREQLLHTSFLASQTKS